MYLQRNKEGRVVRALTVAGSDSGGGAGVQADLKTFAAYSVYGTSVLTALTAQNTLGVQGVSYVDPAFVRQQMTSVLSDIGADAVKTGMLGRADIIEAVVEELRRHRLQHVVVDPVMVAKGGTSLLDNQAVDVVRNSLLPEATFITPNVPEAEVLWGQPIRSWADCQRAAVYLAGLTGGTVIIKGGHAQARWGTLMNFDVTAETSAVDLVYDGTRWAYFAAPRLPTQKTHGTGCTFSAALTAALALGHSSLVAIASARAFTHEAIREAMDWDVGQGHGPTDHSVRPRFVPALQPGVLYRWASGDWEVAER